MPSRAVTSFLHQLLRFCKEHGILRVNALSGCYLISTITNSNLEKEFIISVNALSGCYLISTRDENGEVVTIDPRVSMPSRAVTSFLLDTVSTYEKNKYGVSMPSRAVTSFLLVCIADRYWNSGMGVNALSGCYLISTCMYVKSTAQITSVSMPSRAVTSFLQPSPSFVINKISTVSMPSRAVTSFLHGGDWFCSHSTYCVSMPSRAVTSFLRLLLILLLG